MFLPDLPYKKQKIGRQTVAFGGLNRLESAPDGSFEDCFGVGLDGYPALTQRKGRRQVDDRGGAYGIFGFGKLVQVDKNGVLWYGGERYASLTKTPKQMAVVNTKLCIWPDKVYLDMDSKEFGHLEVSASMAPGTVAFTANSVTVTRTAAALEENKGIYRFSGVMTPYMPRLKVKVFRDDPAGTEDRMTAEEKISWAPGFGWTFHKEPEEIQMSALRNGDVVMFPKRDSRGGQWADYCYDGSEPSLQTPYATEYDTWGDYAFVTDVEFYNSTAEDGYLRVTAERRNAENRNPTLGDLGFKAGDVVDVEGCETLGGNNLQGLTVETVAANTMTFKGENLTPGSETHGTVRITRKVPDLDYVCSANNRLWGCSNKERGIKASAWGDPTNFSKFDGGEDNSWAVAVGTDGDFTGCIPYGSGVLFWKEDCLHKLLGNTDPNEFALYTYQIAGVEAGSAASMQVIDEVLYYKGREGVYAYAGGTPQLLSFELGARTHRKAVGGSDGSRYLVNMERTDGKGRETLVYDRERRLWIKEDEENVLGYADLGGDLYMTTEAGTFLMGQGTDDDGKNIPWQVTLVPFREYTNARARYEATGRKMYSRLFLRLEMEPGAWAEAWVATDQGPFRQVWSSHNSNALTQVVPLRPGRCDRFQLKIRGEGRCTVRNIAREYTLGEAR